MPAPGTEAPTRIGVLREIKSRRSRCWTPGRYPNTFERIEHALTASELGKILAVSPITLYKHAKAGRIPCFRIGTCIRFDPRAIARWLRGQ